MYLVLYSLSKAYNNCFKLVIYLVIAILLINIIFLDINANHNNYVKSIIYITNKNKVIFLFSYCCTTYEHNCSCFRVKERSEKLVGFLPAMCSYSREWAEDPRKRNLHPPCQMMFKVDRQMDGQIDLHIIVKKIRQVDRNVMIDQLMDILLRKKFTCNRHM